MGKPFRSMLSARFSPMTASPTSPICDLALLALGPEDRAPVVDQAAHDLAQRRADALDRGVLLHHLLDHALVAVDLEAAEVLLHALDLHAEHLEEVLLVADEDLDVRDQLLRG